MTDPTLEELRRIVDAPVAPREAFAQSLLERLELVLTGDAVTAQEIDAQSAAELPHAGGDVGDLPRTVRTGRPHGADRGTFAPETRPPETRTRPIRLTNPRSA